MLPSDWCILVEDLLTECDAMRDVILQKQDVINDANAYIKKLIHNDIDVSDKFMINIYLVQQMKYIHNY